MRRINKKYLALGAVPLVILLSFLLMGGGKEVAVTKLQKGTITRSVEDNGYVQPVTDYELQVQQTGKVAQVLRKIGQKEKKGDTLLVLENPDLKIQRAEAHTRLSQAQSAVLGAEAAQGKIKLALADAENNYHRARQLYEANAISKVELEQALLQVQNLEKSLIEAGAVLEGAKGQITGLSQMIAELQEKERELVLTSPIDGVVLSMAAKEGQYLMPGVVAAKLGDTSKLEIKSYILSDDLAEVTTGQKVKITAPVLGERSLKGQVLLIYPEAQEKVSALGVIQRRVPVIISLEDGANLQPGYEVRVAIETAVFQDLLVVPREAVRTNKAGKKEVLQVIDGKIKIQQVETGQRDREYLEISSGLKEGDIIVKDASVDLTEKTRVKPITE